MVVVIPFSLQGRDLEFLQQLDVVCSLLAQRVLTGAERLPFLQLTLQRHISSLSTVLLQLTLNPNMRMCVSTTEEGKSPYAESVPDKPKGLWYQCVKLVCSLPANATTNSPQVSAPMLLLNWLELWFCFLKCRERLLSAFFCAGRSSAVGKTVTNSDTPRLATNLDSVTSRHIQELSKLLRSN